MVGENEAEGPVDGLLDADAGSDEGRCDREAVIANLERGVRVGEVDAVVGGADEAEGLAEAAGSGGKLAGEPVGKRLRLRTGEVEGAVAGHLLNAGDGLEGAQKDAAGLAFCFAGDVHAEVAAVDGVDVGVAGVAEENQIARSGTAMGMGCGVGRGVMGAEIGFGFNDATDDGGRA